MVTATERAVDAVLRHIEQEASRNVELEVARVESMTVRQRAPQPVA